MSLGTDQREWNDLARADAMWAVYSDPARRGRWNAESFFATGREEIDTIMARLDEHGWRPSGADAALDFGCGVGRLTRALSSHFDRVTGVDVAEDMVRQARELNADHPGCDFVVNTRPDLGVLDDASVDFVLSLITLQHVSDKALIRAYVRDFARIARPGATIVFSLPIRVGARVRLHPKRVANRVLRRLPRAPGWALRGVMSHSMSLNSLPEAEVRAILAGGGADTVAAVPDNRVGSDAAPSVTYVAVKR